MIPQGSWGRAACALLCGALAARAAAPACDVASEGDSSTLVLALHLALTRGCIDPRALNFEPTKSVDDGSCRFFCNLARPAPFASRSVRRALLTSQINPGSLYRSA